MADSHSSYQIIGRYFGMPAIIAAYFCQPDVALLSSTERSLLMLVVIGGVCSLVVVFETFDELLTRTASAGAVLLVATILWNVVVHDQYVSILANDRRCLAIQADMLSAHPRRADDPDMFQALGCRPRGEGSVYAPPRLIAK